jgi:hypothetical protein
MNARVQNSGSAPDVFRITAETQDPGWSVHLANALVAVKPGETVIVPVPVTWTDKAGPAANVGLTVSSESDPNVRRAATIAFTSR